MKSYSSERGNALFYILIAIALITALSFAIASSLRGNAGISTERVSIIASDIVASGTRVAEAVARIRLREVPKANICFLNGTVDDYGPPSNSDCTDTFGYVFGHDGGGLSWEPAPAGAGQNQVWGYSGDVAILELGTAEAELIAFLPYLDVSVCRKINALIGLTEESDPPPVITALTGVDKYTGSFNAATTITAVQIKGKKAGCVRAPSASGSAINPDNIATTNQYFYFHVLMTN